MSAGVQTVGSRTSAEGHTLAIVLIYDVAAKWLSGMQILSPIHPHVYLQLDSVRVISLTTLAVVVDHFRRQFLDAVGLALDRTSVPFGVSWAPRSACDALPRQAFSEDQ